MLWLVLTSAHASDVDLFDPAATLPTGRGTLQGEAPQPGQTGATIGVLGAFSSEPVVRTYEDGTEDPAVTSMVPIVVQGGYAVDHRVRFDVVMPIYGWIDAPVAEFSGSAAGDLRIQSTIRVWRTRRLAAAVIPRLTFPTGDADALVGGGWSGGLLASLGGDGSSWGWLVNGGVHVAEAQTVEPAGVPLGSRLEGLAGGWWRASDALRLGVEIDGDLGLASGPDGANHTASVHAFAQHVLPGGLGLLAGAGTGLVSGLGTPDYRVIAALSWSSRRADADADGIVDAADQCPLQAEDFDHFADEDGCPERDNDQDLVEDGSDHCVADPEDIDGWDDDDGCPDPDNDDDGLVDVEDRCPDAEGPEADRGCPDADGDGLVLNDRCPTGAGPAETGGCPDRDGDFVEDERDLCPDEPRPPGEDPAESDGCPKTVYLTASEVRISQRIEFETGSTRLTSASVELLNQVARVIENTPAIERVEVQGHTDSTGSEALNLRLSSGRAASVVAYLTDMGVPPRQLVTQGYGEARPLFANRTPRGREQNRRVQFVILPLTASAPRPTATESPHVFDTAGAVPAATVAPSEITAGMPAVVVTRRGEEDPTPGAPTGPTTAGPAGFLTVKVRGGNWGTVSVDGRKLVKSAPFEDLEVASGTHVVRVENPTLRLGWETTVTIEPGANVTLIVPLPDQAP
jgi:outer membrane protein OmpA-like peptidoglycan-associated protein